MNSILKKQSILHLIVMASLLVTPVLMVHLSNDTSAMSLRDKYQKERVVKMNSTEIKNKRQSSSSSSSPVAASDNQKSNPTDSSGTPDFTSYKDTTTFTCNGKVTGYYADVHLNCKVYHFCTQMDSIDGGSPTYQRMSYICAEDSVFDQKDLNCVKESELKVACDKAEEEYESSNKQFDPKEESQPSLSDNLAANIMMSPLTRFIAGR